MGDRPPNIASQTFVSTSGQSSTGVAAPPSPRADTAPAPAPSPSPAGEAGLPGLPGPGVEKAAPGALPTPPFNGQSSFGAPAFLGPPQSIGGLGQDPLSQLNAVSNVLLSVASIIGEVIQSLRASLSGQPPGFGAPPPGLGGQPPGYGSPYGTGYGSSYAPPIGLDSINQIAPLMHTLVPFLDSTLGQPFAQPPLGSPGFGTPGNPMDRINEALAQVMWSFVRMLMPLIQELGQQGGYAGNIGQRLPFAAPF